MGCPGPQAEADDWFLTLITSRPQLLLDDDTLTIEGATPSVEFAASDDYSPGGAASATVIADQPTLPAGDPCEPIRVATDPGQLQRQWQRFGLAGVPPATDMDQRVVLFAGFGPSGFCPYIFDGLHVGALTVRSSARPSGDAVLEVGPGETDS